MAQGSLLVNDVGGTERDTFIRAILDKAAVITRKLCDKSLKSGMFMGPSPPSLRAFLVYSRWVKWLSMEQPISCVLSFSNSLALSLN